jgi:hypothetical protein
MIFLKPTKTLPARESFASLNCDMTERFSAALRRRRVTTKTHTRHEGCEEERSRQAGVLITT